jgi:hypothetical protein
MIAIVVFAVTATFRPPAPTVGDLITIDFQQPVALDRSPQFEIVSQRGNRVVIRTFEPKPFAISGRTGDVIFRNMIVPLHSVLKPRDNLAPAPLKPPRAEPYPVMPFVLIGVAGALAIAAWTAVVVLARRKERPGAVIVPVERFRAAVKRARSWSELADAVREYIDATTLTTTEVLSANPSETLSEILQQGDLEKFSPWGARPGDLRTLKERAMELAA